MTTSISPLNGSVCRWQLPTCELPPRHRRHQRAPEARGASRADLLVAFATRIWPIDLAVVRRAAAMHVPNPRPERDVLIAATALTLGLSVVTRNTSDFHPLGVELLNPWDQ